MHFRNVILKYLLMKLTNIIYAYMESSTFKHRLQPDFSSISVQRQLRKTPIRISLPRRFRQACFMQVAPNLGSCVDADVYNRSQTDTSSKFKIWRIKHTQENISQSNVFLFSRVTVSVSLKGSFLLQEDDDHFKRGRWKPIKVSVNFVKSLTGILKC